MGDPLVNESDLEGGEIRRKNPEERFSGAPVIAAGRMYVRTKSDPIESG